MSTIGKKILSILNNSSKEKNKRREIKSFDESSSIGILYTWNGSKKEAVIDSLVEELRQDKSVETLCYNPDKKEVIETKSPQVSVADLTMLGKINSSAADSFLKRPFDYLFHLDFEMHEIIEALLINSQANCRVGLHTDRPEAPYELMIGINKSAGLENLIEQMLKYVKALK